MLFEDTLKMKLATQFLHSGHLRTRILHKDTQGYQFAFQNLSSRCKCLTRTLHALDVHEQLRKRKPMISTECLLALGTDLLQMVLGGYRISYFDRNIPRFNVSQRKVLPGLQRNHSRSKPITETSTIKTKLVMALLQLTPCP